MAALISHPATEKPATLPLFIERLCVREKIEGAHLKHQEHKLLASLLWQSFVPYLLRVRLTVLCLKDRHANHQSLIPFFGELVHQSSQLAYYLSPVCHSR